MKNKNRSFLFLGILVVCTVFLIFKFQNNNKIPQQEHLKKIDDLGVSIHRRDVTENDIKNIADAGFKWVRIGVYWELIEKEEGKYNFEKAGYDRINEWIKKYNL